MEAKEGTFLLSLDQLKRHLVGDHCLPSNETTITKGTTAGAGGDDNSAARKSEISVSSPPPRSSSEPRPKFFQATFPSCGG